MTHRRSQAGLILAGGVVIAAGFGVALVEAFRFPRGTVWIVVAAAILLVAAIRRITRPRRAPAAPLDKEPGARVDSRL